MTEITHNPAKDAMTAQSDFQSTRLQEAYDTAPKYGQMGINSPDERASFKALNNQPVETSGALPNLTIDSMVSATKDDLRLWEKLGDDDFTHKENKMESSGSPEYCAEILKANGGHFTDEVRTLLRAAARDGGDNLDKQIQAISDYLPVDNAFHFKKETFPQQGGLPPYVEVQTCKNNERETVIDRMEVPPNR